MSIILFTGLFFRTLRLGLKVWKENARILNRTVSFEEPFFNTKGKWTEFRLESADKSITGLFCSVTIGEEGGSNLSVNELLKVFGKTTEGQNSILIHTGSANEEASLGKSDAPNTI